TSTPGRRRAVDSHDVPSIPLRLPATRLTDARSCEFSPQDRVRAARRGRQAHAPAQRTSVRRRDRAPRHQAVHGGGSAMATSMLDGSISRRRFINRALGGAAASVAVAGLAGRAAAAASELNILFPGGTWKDWYEGTFVKPFADARNIKVVWKTGLGFEPLVIA